MKPCTPSVRATGYKPTDAGGVHRRNESKTALDGGKRESKPVRVFLQGKAIYTTFVHGFAGIAKDPPQSTSLFIPTNVGIHVQVRQTYKMIQFTKNAVLSMVFVYNEIKRGFSVD